MTTSQEVEDVESFRLRAREWIRANVSPATAEDTVGLRAVPAEVEPRPSRATGRCSASCTTRG